MDGFLTPENVEESMKYNYSGRAFRIKTNFFSIRREIKKAINDNGHLERDWVLKQHSIKLETEQYIKLAEKVIAAKGL